MPGGSRVVSNQSNQSNQSLTDSPAADEESHLRRVEPPISPFVEWASRRFATLCAVLERAHVQWWEPGAPCASWMAPPVVARIGGLFPQVLRGTGGSVSADNSGLLRLTAFLLAISDINNKSDGIADSILPNTSLVFAVADSERDTIAAMNGAFALSSECYASPVSAVIGASSSGPSMAVARVLARSHTPQVSYSSTSNALSEGTTYPYFLRTVPADAYQAEGMIDLVYHLFGYGAVALVASPDSYGQGGLAALQESASRRGVNVLVSKTFGTSEASAWPTSSDGFR